MLCEKPYMIGTVPCACMRCFPCRVNRRRIWAHRMDLEARKHGDSSFVTLTYDDENLPPGGTLVPRDTQLWLKRLRKVLAPQKIRYFLAGEYGPQTHRPHYHMALFGIDPFTAGGVDGKGGLVNQTWAKGFTYVGSLTPDSTMYIAGYVTKKMTQGKDSRLGGKQPEFCRMSLRPRGIGAEAMRDIARALDNPIGLESIDQNGDVPSSLVSGKSPLPLGRYLKRVLREELGLKKDTPEIITKAYVIEMQKLLKYHVYNPTGSEVWKKNSHYHIMLDKFAQKRKNLLARTKIYSQKETI